ncbi:hypothetical protein PHPALM_27779 [Phytophthora palmivora]|uniref:Ubiquitin-like protease family profile domain-containing protein n=1 Tax=Phytophthora palmivora TaxID=4796 RepID=A0A2P4XBT4_9STRA|nr:hypothetical protein PHPALM_27779 [Phytophthora palmivora]
MAPDLRVKAVVRPPRHGEQSDGEEAVKSDEEWVESSAESSSTASSTSKQRRSGASDRLQATQNVEQRVVIAPPPEKTEFDSWGAFDVYLKAYSAETYQSFRVRTNNKVASRNNKIRDSGSTKPLVPEEWVHYSKTFVCTHAGKYKPRGQGKRKRQESRALECDVQSDSYNCGVYVLLAFEIFCGSESLGHLDKKTLQCMRYRYLRMCMKEERSSSSSS